MKQKRITEEAIQAFLQYLIRDEKSAVTVEKYLRDVRAFQAFIGETPVEKELVIHYKNHLLEESYAVRSINSMLASVNSFLIFMDWPDCKVKSLKVQRQVYCAEEKELTKAEYNIFHYYIEGYEIARIPTIACVSMSTIKKHNGNIYRKLGISSNDELLMYIDLFRRCGCLERLERYENK